MGLWIPILKRSVGIKVAKYLTELPSREVLQHQIQKSLEITKARFENMIEEEEKIMWRFSASSAFYSKNILIFPL